MTLLERYDNMLKSLGVIGANPNALLRDMAEELRGRASPKPMSETKAEGSQMGYGIIEAKSGGVIVGTEWCDGKMVNPGTRYTNEEWQIKQLTERVRVLEGAARQAQTALEWTTTEYHDHAGLELAALTAVRAALATATPNKD